MFLVTYYIILHLLLTSLYNAQTKFPTKQPSLRPTPPTSSSPSFSPSLSPEQSFPSITPSQSSPTFNPTQDRPSLNPTQSNPTRVPSTSVPSANPSYITSSPSTRLTSISTTSPGTNASKPSVSPTVAKPSISPTIVSFTPSSQMSLSPTIDQKLLAFFSTNELTIIISTSITLGVCLAVLVTYCFLCKLVWRKRNQNLEEEITNKDHGNKLGKSWKRETIQERYANWIKSQFKERAYFSPKDELIRGGPVQPICDILGQEIVARQASSDESESNTKLFKN